MLDGWLDEYEARWHGSVTPPILPDFLAQMPEAERGPEAARELALVDLERRWRMFFSGASQAPAGTVAGLPPLPTWADYGQFIPGCEPAWVEGVCQEFRVRQAFGDRPHYRQLVAGYPSVAGPLERHLPRIAAEVTQAAITLLHEGRETYCGRLPGRLEIGRRRVNEPSAPALLTGDESARLLIAEVRTTYISRLQCRLEVVARDRVLVQHVARKGSVGCSGGGRLSASDACEVTLPCYLDFHGHRLRIGRQAAPPEGN